MSAKRSFVGTSALLVAALALLLGGCASTTLQSQWKNPDYTGGAFRKMAVFVMSKDDSLRRYAEDQVVMRLPKGTVGVAGYSMFPRLSEDDRERVRARLIQEGFDSVLVSRLVSVDKTKNYVPPQVHLAPGAYTPVPYYGSFHGYYGYASSYDHITPGYTVEFTTVVVETMVYKLPEGTPVWAGSTQTMDPQSKAEAARAIAGIVDEELVRQGLVGTPGR